MPNATEGDDPNKSIIGWGPCKIWGQGRLFSSKCVVIPSPLAKRMGIQNGDYITFKENGSTKNVTIEVKKKGEVEK